jgi:protein N-terminal amidase
MKIACLQFAPELGMVEKNIEKANSILSSTPQLQHRGDQPVWLVLPELSFSGAVPAAPCGVDVDGIR